MPWLRRKGAGKRFISFGQHLKGKQKMTTFNALRDANLKRMPQFKNCHGEPAHSKPDGSDWSPAQWLQAVTGELGEYANVRKKYERGDLTHEQFMAQAAGELADTVTYLDILASQLGIDLGAAVVDKFNRVSERVGSNVFLHGDEDNPVTSFSAVVNWLDRNLEFAWRGLNPSLRRATTAALDGLKAERADTSMRQQAEAWEKVRQLLNELAPELLPKGGSGVGRALDAIRVLHEGNKAWGAVFDALVKVKGDRFDAEERASEWAVRVIGELATDRMKAPGPCKLWGKTEAGKPVLLAEGFWVDMERLKACPSELPHGEQHFDLWVEG
jgi:NTP pyrophosphatase (non-canonical NTP hydrolase)